MGRPGDEAAADAAERDELPPILDYVEMVVPDGDGFLVGDRLSLADIAMASPFVNLRHLSVQLDEARYPKTVAYVRRILSRPSFAPLIEKEMALMERTAPQPQPA
jgi:glutathione S-transferase